MVGQCCGFDRAVQKEVNTDEQRKESVNVKLTINTLFPWSMATPTRMDGYTALRL
jgi:hypothetical protein